VCECGDEASGSSATELVTSLKNTLAPCHDGGNAWATRNTRVFEISLDPHTKLLTNAIESFKQKLQVSMTFVLYLTISTFQNSQKVQTQVRVNKADAIGSPRWYSG
jgi:hypothetical protein